MKRRVAILAALVLIAAPGLAGEWHTGTNNLCTDCHTMHFSMEHAWDGSALVPGTPAQDGNWLSGTGPNHYLLKAPANQLCQQCHDGQTFAPDVVGVNTNVSPTEGRMAGALNDLTLGAPYDTWKGHTLDSTNRPPGYNPDVVSVGADPFPVGSQLECLNCHLNHGIASSYRNLGPRSWGGAGGLSRPTYVIATTNDTTSDVWINIDPATYAPNSGAAATFNPYYDFANIFYNRNDVTLATGHESSNRLANFCASCHGGFHGGPEDPTVGGVPSGAGWDEFDRHPSSAITIGLLGGGHSGIGRYTDAVAAGAPVKVYATDYVGYTDASPGCMTCHKAHGNQNPFGLFFLHGEATTITDEGGYKAGQVETANGYGIGYMNVCGQCHTQGINVGE